MLDDGRPQGSPESLPVQLWRACEPIAFESLHSPFVTAMAQGSLPRLAFQHYLAQDSLYLKYYARAYALALSKCDPAFVGETTFNHLARLLKGVHHELRMHRQYAESWGADIDDVQATPVTQAYIDLLMQVAEDHDSTLAEVLCVMAPCARLYGFIGRQLSNAFPTPEHAYATWIETYGGESYQALPPIEEAMLEEAAASGADSAKLLRLYSRAMQLEVDFFQGQPSTPPPRPIGLLVVDFDETCTQRDTIGNLMAAAVAAQVQAVSDPEAAGALRKELEERMAHLAANYKAKQAELLHQIAPGLAEEEAGQNGSPPSKLDTRGLIQFMNALSDFDVRMNQVVVDSCILKGLRAPDDLVAAAAGLSSSSKGMALREGCREVLLRAKAAGMPLHVLSVNWAAEYVASTLGVPLDVLTDTSALGAPGGEPANGSHTQQGGEGGGDPASLLICNQLELGPDGRTTGGLVRRVQCARDKGEVFTALLQRHGLHPAQHSDPASHSSRQLSVYVGDSTSDLPALLLADYGIVVGSNKLLRQVARYFGVGVTPLVKAPLSGPGPRGVLYETQSWAEVEAFVFGPRSYEQHPYKQEMAALRKAWQQPSEEHHDPKQQQQQQPEGKSQEVVPAQANGSGHKASGEGKPRASANPSEKAAAPSSEASPSSPTGSGKSGKMVAKPPKAAPAAAKGRQVVPPRVLTIAGSDSGGGAGIQADLKAIMACGAYGSSAIAALTAQNTHGVSGVHTPPTAFLEQQIDNVLGDIGADVVKTGMLPTAEVVELVAKKLKQYKKSVRGLVVDPVMIATSGHALAESSVAGALQKHLLPLATLVTPNIPEASALLDGRSIKSVEDMESAARDIHKAVGCQAVLVKGGHLLEGQGGGSVVTDVLFDGHTTHRLESHVVITGNTHGTGCTLASAIAAHLARGLPLLPAVLSARDYLHSGLRHSVAIAVGTGPQRPFNHGWASHDWQGSAGHSGRWAPSRVRQAMTLYAVTDSGQNRKMGRTLEEAVAAAVAGGATIVQIREKELEGGAFLTEARAALKVCRAAGVPLVINDRVDIALALGPDVGVHVGQGDIPCAEVRRLLGPERLLGVSCKTPDQALKAAQQGADYVGCGAVFPTTTKDSRVIGFEGIAAVCNTPGTPPVVAIGGLGLSSAEPCIAAGAAGIAVVTAIFGQQDAVKATQELRAAVDAALAKHKK